MLSSGLVFAGAVRGLRLSAQGLGFNKWVEDLGLINLPQSLQASRVV